MKISKLNLEIPDNCPENCCGKNESFYQGNLCSRCPIFNCKKVVVDNEPFCLIEPENYREDWALVFVEWFKGDMVDCPALYF